jgi:hypothetical protein
MAGNHDAVGLVRQLERLEHQVFGQFVSASFHHQDVVIRACGHQAEAAVLHLLSGGVDDELAIDKADRGTGNRAHSTECC